VAKKTAWPHAGRRQRAWGGPGVPERALLRTFTRGVRGPGYGDEYEDEYEDEDGYGDDDPTC
jgi:hypothetical protein